MQIVYSDRYQIEIGPHVYPTTKYRRIQRCLAERGLSPAEGLVEPEPASWNDLALVHTPEYLGKVKAGGFSMAELAELELPWSPEIAEGFRLMTGGTLVAARLATGGRPAIGGRLAPIVVHLGGGFHHAFADHGEGFCLFNDVAVAIQALRRDGAIARAAVIDCDVHQGNGTAMIFAGDPAVFTFSIHQQHNYPLFKPRSSLDIGLEDGTADAAYLAALESALPRVFASAPDVVFYLAGADPFWDDQLGGLALTLEGLRSRDRLVIAAAGQAGEPLVIVLAGGYARRLDDTVAIHVATVEEAVRRTPGGRGPG